LAPSDFHVFGNPKRNISEARNTVKAEVQKWLPEQDVCCYRQGLENLIVCFDKCLITFGDHVEKQRTDVQTYPCTFLVSTYIREPCFLTYPRRMENECYCKENTKEKTGVKVEFR
jgi:hypothetical protein